jgi:hypothetical protein
MEYAMASKFTRVNLLLILGAAGLTMTACGSSSDIRGDLTPGMMGVNTRLSDKQNNIAITRNLNRRQFWDDLGRLTLLDRPSRLTPVPSTR